MFDPISQIDVDRKNSLPVSDFIKRYLNTGTPVILGDLMRKWPASKVWSFEYLEMLAGDTVVPLTGVNHVTSQRYQAKSSLKLSLREYFDLLRNGENELRMHFYNIYKGIPKLMDDFDYPRLGIKFLRGLPMLFMGGEGCREPMRCEHDLANIILCQFGGTKHVLMIPPEQKHLIYRVPYTSNGLKSLDYNQADFDQYPALEHTHAYVAELNPGDCLYIPSGYWYHTIYEHAGFSMTLRSLPNGVKNRAIIARNTLLTRPTDSLMRRILGRHWVTRNEKMAVRRTHARLRR